MQILLHIIGKKADRTHVSQIDVQVKTIKTEIFGLRLKHCKGEHNYRPTSLYNWSANVQIPLR